MKRAADVEYMVRCTNLCAHCEGPGNCSNFEKQLSEEFSDSEEIPDDLERLSSCAVDIPNEIFEDLEETESLIECESDEEASQSSCKRRKVI